MLCQTIKEGTECFFMGKQGCTYNGGNCHPVVESCQGCTKTVTLSQGVYCQSCPEPEIKWKNGSCNLGTHREGCEAESPQGFQAFPQVSQKKGFQQMGE